MDPFSIRSTSHPRTAFFNPPYDVHAPSEACFVHTFVHRLSIGIKIAVTAPFNFPDYHQVLWLWWVRPQSIAVQVCWVRCVSCNALAVNLASSMDLFLSFLISFDFRSFGAFNESCSLIMFVLYKAKYDFSQFSLPTLCAGLLRLFIQMVNWIFYSGFITVDRVTQLWIDRLSLPIISLPDDVRTSLRLRCFKCSLADTSSLRHALAES